MKTYISLEHGWICFRDEDDQLRHSLKLEQLQQSSAHIEIPEMMPPFGADARIDQLERALKSCSVVLKQYIDHTEKHYATAQEALLEVDKALSL